jgi:hypothetical protein
MPLDLRRIRPLRVLASLAVAVALLTALFLGVRFYQRHTAQKQLVSEFQRLNARVIVLSYAAPAGSGIRIPILNESLTHHRQAELFLYDAKTADEALDKARAHPEIKRIWVNLNVFDRSMQKTIEERIPGMTVQFYTPGPGMR